MKIYINARFLTQSTTGVQRYARGLVKALDRLIGRGEIARSEYDFELLAPREAYDDLYLRHIPLRRVGYLSGHAWEQLELPFYARNGLLLNLCNTGPLLKKRQVATIHDAAVSAAPQGYSLAFRFWYNILLAALGLRAARVITVSAFSKKELVRHFLIKEKKIRVAYPGAEHILAHEPDDFIIDRYRLIYRPFVLVVGSMNPNKNFRAVVRAFELMDDAKFNIIIAGGVNPEVFASTGEPLPAFVRHIGYVTDGELRALYENAACFVFPSLYEGFGLPPLEAMACGCPVVVSGAASLPEVCGEAAVYCNPHKSADIARKIHMIMHYPKLREDLRQKGLKRARHFTWEKTARKTLAVIKEILQTK